MPLILSASIKRGGISEPFDVKLIPRELAKAIADQRAKKIDETKAAKVASKYLAANFLSENLDDGDDLFEDAGEVWAHELECYGWWDAGGVLPRVTAGANFKLKAGPQLPRDEEAMMEWEDENTPLTDAVNFFWKFGDTLVLIGEHEGAGAGIEKFPRAKKKKR
ncbi:MAG: hypothetical protein QM817_24005 [Archangium sp.]